MRLEDGTQGDKREDGERRGNNVVYTLFDENKYDKSDNGQLKEEETFAIDPESGEVFFLIFALK